MTNLTDADFEAFMQRYERTRQPTEEPKSVAATAVKLPVFWLEDPELWFAQVECVFNNRQPKITRDETKYNYVCEVLPARVIAKVRHVILSEVPEAEKYTLMKDQLLKSFGQKSVTKQAELLDMVTNPSMGDNIPSDVLLRIRNLSSSSYKDVERAIFLLHLPPVVRTALASSKATTNDQLADEANAIYLEHKVGARARARTVAAVQWSPDEEDVPWIPDQELAVNSMARSSDRPIPPGCCPVHKRWGWKAFSCKGGSCPMKNEPLAKRPAGSRPPFRSGNGRADR